MFTNTSSWTNLQVWVINSHISPLSFDEQVNYFWAGFNVAWPLALTLLISIGIYRAVRNRFHPPSHNE